MGRLFYRVAAAFFLTIMVVVISVSVLVNYQITENFSSYLHMNHGTMMHSMMHVDMHSMMGPSETQFIDSLKRLLFLTGGFMLLIGIFISYCLARNITAPIMRLGQAVQEVAGGKLDTVVKVTRDDEIGALAGAFNKMTEKLKVNDVLRQRFLAGIAHELRTPLSILKANLEGIKDGVIEPSAEQITSLTDEIDRTTKLVGDLKDLSLLEVGQLKLHLAQVDLNDTFQNLIKRLAPLANRRGIGLSLDVAETLPLIWADAVRVTQMLDNLVVNAINYTPAGGRVMVSARGKADKVEICVADNGIGIAASDLSHIFDYFYRADPSRNKASGGTGLGLAIVRQLAAAHGGSVQAESEPEKGSIFTLVLPVRHGS